MARQRKQDTIAVVVDEPVAFDSDRGPVRARLTVDFDPNKVKGITWKALITGRPITLGGGAFTISAVAED